MAWKPLFPRAEEPWLKAINTLHPVVVLLTIIFGYVIQWEGCFGYSKEKWVGWIDCCTFLSATSSSGGEGFGNLKERREGWLCSVQFFDLAWSSTRRSSGCPELRLVEFQDAPNRDQSRVMIWVFSVSDRSVSGAQIATDPNRDPPVTHGRFSFDRLSWQPQFKYRHQNNFPKWLDSKTILDI